MDIETGMPNFQSFRPGGAGVERLFAKVNDGPYFLDRIRKIFSATSGRACANDLYFIVRSQKVLPRGELLEHGQNFLSNLRSLSFAVKDGELIKYIGSLEGVSFADRDADERDENGETIVHEALTDWMGDRLRGSWMEAMNEAYFQIACDHFLAWYLQWPFFRDTYALDVFDPYLNLWLSGTRCSFGKRSLILSHVAV